MNIGWGTRIAMLYIGFVVLIVSLVAGTALKKTELVAGDYYQQEVAFQHRLDAAHAAAALDQQVKAEIGPEEIVLYFPAIFKDLRISGSVHFYAPASAAADRTVSLAVAGNRMVVRRKALKPAVYEAQVSYAAGGRHYYQALPLNLR